MLPPTLGVALLCNSRAGSDMWLYPELITYKSPWRGNNYRCVDHLAPCYLIQIVIATKFFYFWPIDIAILSEDLNLGPKAFYLLQFEIAPQTTWPTQPVRIDFWFAEKNFIIQKQPSRTAHSVPSTSNRKEISTIDLVLGLVLDYDFLNVLNLLKVDLVKITREYSKLMRILRKYTWTA